MLALNHSSFLLYKFASFSAPKGSVYSWLSVPYAAPPVGKNRFMRTYEKEPWTGQLDATRPSPACIQEDALYLSSDFEGLNMWKSKSAVSEDCLYLNIWAPADAYKSINKTGKIKTVGLTELSLSEIMKS